MCIHNKNKTVHLDISKCGCFKSLGLMFEIEKYNRHFTIYRFTIGFLLFEIELRIRKEKERGIHDSKRID